MNNHPISKDIINNALTYDRPFKTDEVSGEPDLIEEILDESALFFCNFDSCGTRTYLSKKFFFNGSEFTVHLNDYEVKNKILVAPLRFLPFTPDMPQLTLNGVKTVLTSRKIPLKCLENIYSLDHGQGLIKHLNEISEKTLLNLHSLVNEPLTVYDLSAVELNPGDHLHLKLMGDKLEGTAVTSENIDLAQAQKWCMNFEKSLQSVLREFGPFTDLYTQLELAYYYGGKNLREEGGLAVRDFLNLSKKLTLCDFVFRKIIWFSDSDPLDSAEAKKKIQHIQNEFLDAPEVNPAFYYLLDDKLKKSFSCLNEDIEDPVAQSPALTKVLKRTVRRVALWITSNHHIISDVNMPVSETLMFAAAFDEFQFLCDYFVNRANIDHEEFEEALRLNFEILSELMEFLKEYFHS